MEDLSKADGAAPLGEGRPVEAGTESASRETVVIFTTNLPEKFRLPEDPFVVPAHFGRLDLSKLVNQLLHQKLEADDSDDGWHHQPFDFLIDGKLFLRTSLHEYMTSHGLTAEVPLQLEYHLAVRRLREQHLPSSRDWIASLASLPRQGLLVEASYDGSCRVHRLSGLSSAGSRAAATDSNPGSVTQFPLSSTLVEVGLGQGPLGAAAAYAGGAYMPSGCLQVLLGSKGGGYNVVHVWEEQQQERKDNECFSQEELEISEESVSGGTDAANRASSGNRFRNKSGSRKPGDERFNKRSIRAALNAVGCQGSEVTCLDVSSDGVTAASGGADGKVLLWDNVPDMKAAATQHQGLEEFEGRSRYNDAERRGLVNGSASTKAFGDECPSATTASASAIPYKRKRVARKASLQFSSPRIRAKEPKLVLDSHTDRVSDLCFPAHPLRCVLYTSSLDETVCGWDTLVGGAPLSVWTTSCPVTSVSCSPVDGTVICSAHVDGRLRLWDIRSGTVATSIDVINGGGRQTSTDTQVGPHDNGSSTAHLFAGPGTVLDSHRGSRGKFGALSHVVLSANSRFDRRFTFGNVPDRRATTRARWCPVKTGEYWIATVSQDGMLRLRDLRAPSMPLFSVEVRGRRSDECLGRDARSSAAGEISQGSGEEKTDKKGPPVRLLSCSWLDGNRIATGGSDGIIRVFTVGAPALVEHALH